MLRSPGSLTYEAGYHWLKGRIDDHLDDLVQLMQSETDPNTRSLFVELVGDSGNPKVIPLLKAELENPHGEVRCWAYSSLLHFGNPEATKIAENFSKANPNEDFL